MAEENKEWWEPIDLKLNDLLKLWPGAGLSTVLDDLEHLYRLRILVKKRIEDAKRHILETYRLNTFAGPESEVGAE